jgi:hypothetical protein
MISIDGLSKKQVAFLKIIWSFDNEDHFHYWYTSLPYGDKLIVESLLEIIKYEVLEETIDLFESDANDILERVRYGNV